MRQLRHLYLGDRDKALVEVTVRTVHSRYLLKPSTLTNALVLGIFAKAQARYKTEICAYAVLSNHLHLLLYVDSAVRLASFMRYVNSNIARKIGRLYSWRQKFFSRRYRAIQVSHEEKAQAARLYYLLSQGAKEGLVASPLEWPGAHAAWHLYHGQTEVQGWWEDQTAAYRAKNKGERVKRGQYRSDVTLHLSQIPAWDHLSPKEYRERIRELIQKIEEEVRAEGKPVLGVERILRQNPRKEPKSTKKESAPDFHAATKEALQALRYGYREFVAAFRQAAERLRGGDLGVVFPPDSFPPRFPAPIRG